MRYLYHVLLASLGFVTAITSAQSLESYLHIGGVDSDAIANVERDVSGNLYVVGSFANIVDFNPNGTPHQLESSNTVRRDVFVAKYNKDKTLNWVVQLGNKMQDLGFRLLLDDSLNVYIIGRAEGLIDFNPSFGIHELYCASQYFVLKLNNNGEFQAVYVTPTSTANAPSLGVELFKDDMNNIYGYTCGNLYKFDSNLNLLWSQNVGGFPELYNQTEIHAIEVDVTKVIQEVIGTDVYLKVYDTSNGNLLSNNLIGHTEGYLDNRVVQRANNGDLLLYGHYWGSLVLNGGGDSIVLENYQLNTAGLAYEYREYVCRYDGEGNLLWAKDFEHRGSNPNILKTDDNGHIYSFGNINYFAAFDPYNPVLIHAELPPNNSYIAKYDSAFNLLNVTQFLGIFSRIGDVQFYDNDMVICGSFYPPIDIDLSPGTQHIETNGIDDAFVLEYSDYQSLFIDEEVESHFGVSTNPLTGTVQVSIKSFINSGHMVSVYDLNGRVLNRFNTEDNTINLDLSAYPNGTYFIQVSNDEWSATEKVVK